MALLKTSNADFAKNLQSTLWNAFTVYKFFANHASFATSATQKMSPVSSANRYASQSTNRNQ